MAGWGKCVGVDCKCWQCYLRDAFLHLLSYTLFAKSFTFREILQEECKEDNTRMLPPALLLCALWERAFILDSKAENHHNVHLARTGFLLPSSGCPQGERIWSPITVLAVGGPCLRTRGAHLCT